MHDTLTPRELEVLKLICKGYDNPEIANELFIHIQTVNSHVNHILAKFEVHSMRKVIYKAYQYGLVLPPNPENLECLVKQLENYLESKKE